MAAPRASALHNPPDLRSWRRAGTAEHPFRFLSECRQSNVGKRWLCGRSSVVERQLPKLYVEGSIPFARSSFFK